MSYSQKRVSYAPQPRQDSLGNSGDPNACVAFAGENKDFLNESIAPEAKSLQQPCLMGEQFSRLAAYKAVEPFQSYVRFV